ncbi:hypothetical protein Tco_1499568 [Tanacetum coccineum]
MSTKVPTSNKIVMTSMPELESLFGPLFDEYFNRENLVVSKSSAVTTADASNKRQQQPDSASSTSTLAITVTTDGNKEFMIQVKEMMQDKDLKNSKSNDKDLKNSKSKHEGSRSRSRSMNAQSHYKQEKTKTRPKKAKLKRHIFNVGEIKEDLNIGGDC